MLSSCRATVMLHTGTIEKARYMTMWLSGGVQIWLGCAVHFVVPGRAVSRCPRLDRCGCLCCAAYDNRAVGSEQLVAVCKVAPAQWVDHLAERPVHVRLWDKGRELSKASPDLQHE